MPAFDPGLQEELAAFVNHCIFQQLLTILILMLIPRGVWITRHTELFHPKLMMGQTDSDSHKLTAMNDPVETTPMMGQTVVDSDSYDSDPDPDEG